MDVELIALTHIAGAAIDRMMDRSGYGTDSLAEFSGRTCYLSYSKPNPKTRENKDYLANILRQGHESVLEHASASFYVEGVSRNMLLELECHRFLSFSVVSTRYVDANQFRVVTPPALEYDVCLGGIDPNKWLDDYNHVFESLMCDGRTRKQAREAAANYLPGGLETRFVVSGNFRAWRDVIKKRNSEGANAEIRRFARKVLLILKANSPNSFQDLEV